MTADPDLPSASSGHYVIHAPLASGGMGTVHIGRRVGPVGFSRPVAIKRMHPHHAKDAAFLAMFLDEARLASRIRHPNVVATLDVVSTPDEVLVVMEYVHGESLARLQREGSPPLRIVLGVVTQMLYGLHAAHEARDTTDRPLEI